MNRQKGITQIAVMVVMMVMAIALPVTTKLVQQNQENRSKAATTYPCDRCSANNGCQKAVFQRITPDCTLPVGTVTYTTDCSCGRKNGAGGGTDATCDLKCSSIPSVRLCTEADWSFTLSPSTCPSSGQQTKTWTHSSDCSGGVVKFSGTVNCTYTPPVPATVYCDCGGDDLSFHCSTTTWTATNHPAGCTTGKQTCRGALDCTAQNSMTDTTVTNADPGSVKTAILACPAGWVKKGGWNEVLGKCDTSIPWDKNASQCPSGKLETPINQCGDITKKGSCGGDPTQTCPSGYQNTTSYPFTCVKCADASTPACTDANWTSTVTPSVCPTTGQQTKTWTRTGSCTGGVTHPATETVSCAVPGTTVDCTPTSNDPSGCSANYGCSRIAANYKGNVDCKHPITSGDGAIRYEFDYKCQPIADSILTKLGTSGNNNACTCTAGTKKCSNNVLYTCNSNGIGWAVVDCGGLGCNATTNTCNTAVVACTDANWTSTLSPSTCPSNSQQTKTWTKVGTCTGGVNHPATEVVSCTYTQPTVLSRCDQCRLNASSNPTSLLCKSKSSKLIGTDIAVWIGEYDVFNPSKTSTVFNADMDCDSKITRNDLSTIVTKILEGLK